MEWDWQQLEVYWLVVMAVSLLLLIVGLVAESKLSRFPSRIEFTFDRWNNRTLNQWMPRIARRHRRWLVTLRVSQFVQFYLAIGFWWYVLLDIAGSSALMTIARLWFYSISGVYLIYGALLTWIAYIAVMKLKETGRPIYFWRFSFSTPSNRNEPPTNIVTDVTRAPIIGLSNLFLLTVSVPVLAYPEELIFRELPMIETSLWLRVAFFLFISIFVFSLVHIVSGYDIATLIVMACTTAGAMTVAYAYGGMIASIQLHTAINLVAIPFYGGTHDGREVAQNIWEYQKVRLAWAYVGFKWLQARYTAEDNVGAR